MIEKIGNKLYININNKKYELLEDNYEKLSPMFEYRAVDYNNKKYYYVVLTGSF